MQGQMIESVLCLARTREDGKATKTKVKSIKFQYAWFITRKKVQSYRHADPRRSVIFNPNFDLLTLGSMHADGRQLKSFSFYSADRQALTDIQN